MKLKSDYHETSTKCWNSVNTFKHPRINFILSRFFWTMKFGKSVRDDIVDEVNEDLIDAEDEEETEDND